MLRAHMSQVFAMGACNRGYGTLGTPLQRYQRVIYLGIRVGCLDSVRLLQIRRVLSLWGRGPCAHLTWTFSYSILVLPGLSASSRWPSAGRLGVNKCTVFCRNIQRNIHRYWILRRLCRSISCSASEAGMTNAYSGFK